MKLDKVALEYINKWKGVQVIPTLGLRQIRNEPHWVESNKRRLLSSAYADLAKYQTREYLMQFEWLEQDVPTDSYCMMHDIPPHRKHEYSLETVPIFDQMHELILNVSVYQVLYTL